MRNLTTVRPPRNAPWPTGDVVQLGPPSPTMRGTVQDVFLDGAPIGRLEGFTPTPARNAQRSKQWRTYPGTGRPSWDTRGEALLTIIRDHQERRGGPAMPVPFILESPTKKETH